MLQEPLTGNVTTCPPTRSVGDGRVETRRLQASWIFALRLSKHSHAHDSLYKQHQPIRLTPETSAYSCAYSIMARREACMGSILRLLNVRLVYGPVTRASLYLMSVSP